MSDKQCNLQTISRLLNKSILNANNNDANCPQQITKKKMVVKITSWKKKL